MNVAHPHKTRDTEQPGDHTSSGGPPAAGGVAYPATIPWTETKQAKLSTAAERCPPGSSTVKPSRDMTVTKVRAHVTSRGLAVRGSAFQAAGLDW